MGCRWQTVEDRAPRGQVVTLLMHEGHVTEHLFIAVPIRMGPDRLALRTHLVVRASQVSGEVTAAWEGYLPERGQ